MNLLATILGYNHPIPDAPATRIHRIGFATSMERYIPRHEKPKGELKESEAAILKILKCQVKPITAAGMEKKTRWSKNHCNVIMAGLFLKGLLTREKIRVNKTSMYAYRYKKAA